MLILGSRGKRQRWPQKNASSHNCYRTKHEASQCLDPRQGLFAANITAAVEILYCWCVNQQSMPPMATEAKHACDESGLDHSRPACARGERPGAAAGSESIRAISIGRRAGVG